MTVFASRRAVLCGLATLPTLGVGAPATPFPPGDTSNFARIVGNRVMYRGQTVKLRGMNFSNISAWKILEPAVWGSGLLSNINQDERDYAKLKSMGANHIRFGMAYHWFEDDRRAFWAFMDQHVAWARAHDLWMIPELHVVPGNAIENYSQTAKFWTNATHRNQIKQFWIEFATRYNNEPVMLAFDLLNEPTPPGPGYQSTWWTFASELASAIVAVNQTAKVMVETNPSAVIWEPIPNAPANRIIYSAHWYKPMALTHGPDNAAGGAWPGNYTKWYGHVFPWSKAAIMGQGDPAADIKSVTPINWCEDAAFPMYIGEWGCNLPTAPSIAYTQDMADIFVNHIPSVGHAYFSWRGAKHQWAIYPPNIGNFTPWDTGMEAAVTRAFVGSTDPAFV